MPSLGMDAGRWVLAATDAEIYVIDSPLPDLPVAVPAASDEPLLATTTWTLTRFRERFGQSWVPGRIEISAEAVSFRPREAEAASAPIALNIRDIIAVDTIVRLFSKTVRVSMTSGVSIVVRCRNPHDFAEQLRSAAGAVRAAAA